MSYPRKLQILVIEDDYDVTEAYKSFFEDFKVEGYQITPPVFARSFSDGKRHIDSDTIFQVVILDLNLPIESRGLPEAGFAPGEMLLEAIAKRDAVPVPVVLVISGKLGGPHSITAVQDRLTHDFYHARLVVKSSSDEFEQIRLALDQAHRYLDVGVHIRDSGRNWFPTLTPREDDLLRRCVLMQPSTLGVDLRWWNAEQGPSTGADSPSDGGTKVLMGHFLLDDGIGVSIPTFFKFEPAGNAASVGRDAAILSQKLAHVKVITTMPARQRGLLATQSVTARGIPVSLNEYLHREPISVAPNLKTIVRQITDQLCALGNETESEMPLRLFFWKYLEFGRMQSVWNAYAGSSMNAATSPLDTFRHLSTSALTHWAKWSTCAHGDLNSTNIAIDATQPESVSAYIFDAAGVRSDFAYRDLAYLEVTTILFNSSAGDDHLLQACEVLYLADEFVPNAVATSNCSAIAQNVMEMVRAIRQQVVTAEEQKAYALLLFDSSLRQLFGLGIQLSANKIKNPGRACLLACRIGIWLRQLAPEWFVAPAPGQASS